MKRARDKFGLGSPGAEIRWTGDEERRPKKPKKREPARRVVLQKAKPHTPVCWLPDCPERGTAPTLPDRFACAVCAEKLELRAAAHREREQARQARVDDGGTVNGNQSAPASADTNPGHDQGGNP